MPYNGSGSFSAPSSSFPASAGALIESAKYNNVVNDIASGLSNAITKDGQTAVTANLPMAGFKHTNVGDAVTRTDYASAKQVQDSSMLYAGTAAGTADAITLTLTPAIAAYAAGQSFLYKSGASANTGAMTVNINGAGAKAIQINGAALVSGDHPAGKFMRITYDGTAFQLERIGSAVHVYGTQTIAGDKTFTGLTQITGTTSATVIGVGFIGEATETNVEAGDAVALTTGVTKNVTSRVLTAGHWDVGGIVNFTLGGTTQISSLFGGTSLVSGTPDNYQFSHRCAAFTPGATTMGYALPPRILRLSSSTTIYLLATAGFTGGTCAAWGYLRTRRVA